MEEVDYFCAGEQDKINVCCVARYRKSGWLNITPFDGRDTEGNFNPVLSWPLKAKVKYVYAERFLERLHPSQAIEFLRNAQVGLIPTGRIRLSTISLERAVLNGFASAHTSRQLRDSLAINRAFRGWGHKFLWSRPLLEAVLLATGFAEVTFHDYGISDDPELQSLECHGGFNLSHGFPTVWNVEAIKHTGAVNSTEIIDQLEEDYTKYTGTA